FGDPVRPCGGDLTHFVDPLHEAGELLELRPLVVRRAYGHLDFDGLFDARHETSSGVVCGPINVPCSVRHETTESTTEVARDRPRPLGDAITPREDHFTLLCH